MKNNLPSNWSQYFDPSAFLSSGGLGTGGGIGSLLDPSGGLGMLSGLFGGGSPSWQPYVDANGNYVWSNPKHNNPVPVTQVPGASLRPNKTYRQEADMISALTTLFPEYSSIIAGQAIPQAQAALTAAQATAPGYEALARQQELEQGATDTAALQAASAPGGLIESTLNAQKQIDPEYYATRTKTADALSQLLSGIGPTVSREIGQGLAQSNAQSGTLNSPSQLNTVSNALQYGREGRSALTQAVQAATQAMPALTSGMNAFQMTTGRSPVPNTTTGTSGLTNAASLGQSMAGNLNQAQMTNNQINGQLQMNSKDWADYLGQVTSSVGNIVGAAGSIAGMACWIARKVYGENNHMWLLFRHYLFNKAPSKFREFYLKHGEKLARKLTQEDCDYLRPIMNQLILN